MGDGSSTDDDPSGEPTAGPDDAPGASDLGAHPVSRADGRVLIALAAGSAVAAALSGADPTGLGVADVVWCALAGAVVAWAGARASAGWVAWAGAVAAVVGVGGGWLPAAFGLLALATGVAAAWDRRPSPETGALAAALAVQALLRGPSYGPVWLPTLVAFAAVVPLLVSAWANAPAAERRVGRSVSLVVLGLVLVASLGAALAALLARPDLEAASDQAEEALALLRDGDLEASAAPLEESSAGFSDASSILGGPLAWAGRAVPVVGQHVDALARVADAGEELTSATAEAATSANYDAIKADGGRVDLAEVESMAGPVRASADAAIEARLVVAEVRSPWLIGPVTSQLDRLDDELADTVPAAVDAADALEVAPALLGADGPRRYLLQFATPGETRGAGGFIGTYGVLVADDGQLDLGETGSTQELGPEEIDPATDPPLFPFDPPPDWEDLYGNYHVGWFPGNVSASPDWPTDSDVARQLYESVPGVGSVDGVLYADPAALAALLELTGPVDVEGVEDPLDATNVEQFLYVDQYVLFEDDLDLRRGVLAEVTSAVFEALTSRPLPSLGDVTSTLGPVVSSGHLKFVSFDERAEDLFVRTGLAGAWRTTPGADWVSLRSANMLPNKIDWFLQRDWTVDAVVDPTTGQVESTVTVVLTNEAPPDGLPPYLIGNVDGLPYGTNQDALSLYTPHAALSITVDGQEVGAQTGSGFGGRVYTVPVVIPPGATRTVVFTLRGSVPAGLLYRLDLLAQPLANPDQATVTLRAADSPDSVILFEGPLDEDVQLAAIGR